ALRGVRRRDSAAGRTGRQHRQLPMPEGAAGPRGGGCRLRCGRATGLSAGGCGGSDREASAGPAPDLQPREGHALVQQGGAGGHRKKLLSRPHEQMWFLLARTVTHSTVEECKQRMSHQEFKRWLALYKLEPWGDEWGQTRAVAASNLAPWSKKRI